MSDKKLEHCGYCGEMHEQDDPPFTVGGIPIKECPSHPINFPQMTLVDTSAFQRVLSDHINLDIRHLNLQDDGIEYEPSGGVTSCWACNGSGCNRCVDWIEE